MVQGQASTDAEEIAFASEAAPAHITSQANFMAFRDGKFETILQGTNNFTCLVVRDLNGRFEPSCFNQPAMESVFHTYELEMQLLYDGHAHPEVMQAIEEASQSEKIPSAAPGSLVYMMSPNNKFYDYNRERLGNSPIHQMYYFPKLSDETFSLSSGPIFLWQGYPHLTAVIVVVGNDQ